MFFDISGVYASEIPDIDDTVEQTDPNDEEEQVSASVLPTPTTAPSRPPNPTSIPGTIISPGSPTPSTNPQPSSPASTVTPTPSTTPSPIPTASPSPTSTPTALSNKNDSGTGGTTQQKTIDQPREPNITQNPQPLNEFFSVLDGNEVVVDDAIVTDFQGIEPAGFLSFVPISRNSPVQYYQNAVIPQQQKNYILFVSFIYLLSGLFLFNKRFKSKVFSGNRSAVKDQTGVGLPVIPRIVLK